MHPPAGRSPGSDPLLDPATPRSGGERSERRTQDTPSGAAPRRGAQRPPPRRHPASGARAVALTASVVATGAIAAALAYSEGAWSAGAEVAATASDDQPTGTNETASTSTVPPDAAAIDEVAVPVTSNVPATTPSSTPETTQPAETPIESSGFADGEFLGSVEDTEWGAIQVQVTIDNGAIVGVGAVQYPTGRKSTEINSQAIPMLEANAVAIQDANVDIVSGATYTSHTYADSLQAALDQAALAVVHEASTS